MNSRSIFNVINLNTDQSISAQKQLYAKLDVIADLSHQVNNLRLWTNNLGLAYLRQMIKTLRQTHQQPWLTFLGSGDFHHYSLALLETLPQDQPITLVLIDNHPDWFYGNPTFHCGNWVSGVLDLPWVESIILVGQDSNDLQGHHFWNAPWMQLCSGRLKLYPYRRAQSFIPMKWPKMVSGVKTSARNPLGVTLSYTTVNSFGEERFFDDLASKLAGQRIYLSIDKDSLKMDAAITDWEQGCLSLTGLVYGIGRLRESCQIVGADVCGESAPQALTGLAKKIDAGRFKKSKLSTATINDINEKTNLEILAAFSNAPVQKENLLCPA
jgi:arginase family enzyme